MRATIEFNLPEDKDEYKMAILGAKFKSALEDIEYDIFRPPLKHGFDDRELQDLYEKHSHVRKYHELLAKRFYNIISEVEQL